MFVTEKTGEDPGIKAKLTCSLVMVIGLYVVTEFVNIRDQAATSTVLLL